MTDSTLSREEIADTIRSEVDREVRKGAVDIYEELLANIWDRIIPTLGGLTVATITQKAIARAKETYPLVAYLQVSEEGVSFDDLRDEITSREDGELRNALKEVVGNLFDILAKLTGNILVSQLMREIEGLDVQ